MIPPQDRTPQAARDAQGLDYDAPATDPRLREFARGGPWATDTGARWPFWAIAIALAIIAGALALPFFW